MPSETQPKSHSPNTTARIGPTMAEEAVRALRTILCGICSSTGVVNSSSQPSDSFTLQGRRRGGGGGKERYRRDGNEELNVEYNLYVYHIILFKYGVS